MPRPACPLGSPDVANRQDDKRKLGAYVSAVDLNPETPRFTDQKWGRPQTCKVGDWLVCNQGDAYTIDADVFARTHARVSDGALREDGDGLGRVGQISRSQRDEGEGSTHDSAGDYLVGNDDDDAWAVRRERFEELYAPLE